MDRGTLHRLAITNVRRRTKLVGAAKDLLWFDRRTTAAYLGIGQTTLAKLTNSGILKSSKLGRRSIYNRQHLDEYMARLAGLTQ